jgi:hypothetical protein
VTRKGGTISLAAAENQLNVIIERRDREAEEANTAARRWTEEIRCYNLAAQAERREQWRRCHEDLAAIHSRIAAEHEQQAARLAETKGAA